MSKKLLDVMRGAKRKPKAEDAPLEDDIDPNAEGDELDPDAEGDDVDPNAEGDELEPDAEDQDSDVDAEDDDENYTVEGEETDEEMAAAVRGSGRVLSILGSDAAKNNMPMALKLAANPKLSASDAMDILADVKSSDGKGKLGSRLRGNAKGLGRDAVAPKGNGKMSAADRILAASKAAIKKKKQR